MKKSKLPQIIGGLAIIAILVAGWLITFKVDRTIQPFTYFDPNKLHSEAVCLMDRETGEIIYGYEEEQRRSPASLTKLLTVLVAIEASDDLKDEAVVDTASYQMMVEAQASMAGFYGEELVTVEDLLYGTMLSSGGETALSLAHHFYEEPSDFVRDMNRRAASIPMEKSYFVNPTGMDAQDQVSTAKDICKLTREALNNETFYRIFTQKLYWTSKTPSHPEGILLESTVLGKVPATSEGYSVLGGKSGTTMQAGLCWTTLVQVGDKEYILTTLGAPKELEEQVPQWEDAKLIIQELIEPSENVRNQ